MLIKVEHATPLQLDWLVSTIEGRDVYIKDGELVVRDSKGFVDYTTDQVLGGELIDRENITTIYYGNRGPCGQPWEAMIVDDTYYLEIGPGIGMSGQTRLIAAVRAFVNKNLGEEVEVPDELA